MALNERSIGALIYVHKQVELLPSFSWLSSAYDLNDTGSVATLLRSEHGEQDQQICACFKVSKKVIEHKLTEGIDNIEELGLALGCGSKCGSCKPELNRILKARPAAFNADHHSADI